MVSASSRVGFVWHSSKQWYRRMGLVKKAVWGGKMYFHKGWYPHSDRLTNTHTKHEASQGSS